MREMRPGAWSLALGATLFALGVSAAEGPPQFPVQADLVVLSASAVDGKGRPVVDLRPEELRIYDEGRPQKLEYFAQADDVPARVLLLVDASGSMNGALKTASARMAALQVLAALAPTDEAALVGFDRDSRTVVDFTANKGAVLTGFDGLKPFGSTALHDALEQAARDLAGRGRGRRAVVVITDGVDTSSRHTPDEVIRSSRALDVPIYAISVASALDDPASPRFVGRSVPSGQELLARYSAESGGRAFVVSDFGGLKGAASRIAQELKHQYRLGYDPPAGPPRFRHVEVRTSRRNVRVRTRSGYIPAP
jgi:Ca-activated chloride channel homolog